MCISLQTRKKNLVQRAFIRRRSHPKHARRQARRQTGRQARPGGQHAPKTGLDSLLHIYGARQHAAPTAATSKPDRKLNIYKESKKKIRAPPSRPARILPSCCVPLFDTPVTALARGKGAAAAAAARGGSSQTAVMMVVVVVVDQGSGNHTGWQRQRVIHVRRVRSRWGRECTKKKE